MERLIHANDNAREAKVTLWIFEGSSLYVLIVSVALALAGFRYAYDRLGLGTWASAGVGVAPLILASVYVLTLKLGKPKSHAVDSFLSLCTTLLRWRRPARAWRRRTERAHDARHQEAGGSRVF